MNDLDWADRETVLRLLFSKMNTGDQATNWRDSMPSATHSRSSNKQNSELNKAHNEAEGDQFAEEYYDEEEPPEEDEEGEGESSQQPFQEREA